jgi:hypothetical protein
MRRGIRSNVLKRIAGNQQRVEEAQQREEREREKIKLLNQREPESKKND